MQHLRESPFSIGRPGRQRQKTEGLPESPRLLDRCGWDCTGGLRCGWDRNSSPDWVSPSTELQAEVLLL